jgi:hypothetical protein
MRATIKIVVGTVAAIILLCVVAALLYFLFASDFVGSELSSTARCRGMPTGNQRDLCENFASSHPEQVRPMPPDRQPLPNIEGAPR